MIGVFDSGLGGLTVLKELIKQLPEYDYAYLGDSARSPYGDKSQAVIYEYTRQAVDFLFKQGSELIIIACNTASAKALRRIQQEWLPKHFPERRVLGVVIPAVEIAVEELDKPKHKKPIRIGIIGTRATIESAVYETEMRKVMNGDRPSGGKGLSTCKLAGGTPGSSAGKMEFYDQACPLLVPLVEEGWTGKTETKMILKKYLRPLKMKGVSALILGCTHYPFLEPEIKRIMGKNVRIIDTPRAVAAKLKDYLARHPEIENRLGKNKKRVFYTTDEAARFKELARKFIGNGLREVRQVEL